MIGVFNSLRWLWCWKPGPAPAFAHHGVAKPPMPWHLYRSPPQGSGLEGQYLTQQREGHLAVVRSHLTKKHLKGLIVLFLEIPPHSKIFVRDDLRTVFLVKVTSGSKMIRMAVSDHDGVDSFRRHQALAKPAIKAFQFAGPGSPGSTSAALFFHRPICNS